MRGWVKLLCSVACSVLLVPICGFAPDLSQKIGADVIVTAAPSYSPLAALQAEFAAGGTPESVCARSIRELTASGVRHFYVSNLPVGKAAVTLQRILALV